MHPSAWKGILRSWTSALRSSKKLSYSVHLGSSVPSVSLDIRGGLLGRDPALRGAHHRHVSQRIVPRANSHLRLDRLQAAAPGGRHAMVAVGQEQAIRGLEDDDWRQGVDHPGVALHPCGVEVSLRVDRSVGEEIVYPQHRHAPIFAVGPRIRNPVAVPIHSSAWRDCLKSPDSPETKVVEAYETDQKDPFCCGMQTILAHETPLSDFLDSFGRGILRTSPVRSSPKFAY